MSDNLAQAKSGKLELMPDSVTSTVDKYLVAGIENKATTIYMFPGACITYRVGNKLLKVPNTALNSSQTLAIALAILPPMLTRENSQEERLKYLEKIQSATFSYSIKGKSRFTVNLFRQRGSLALTIRVIPQKIPDLGKYNIPEDFYRFLNAQQGGLFIIHGRGRSGKSSLLAAIIDYINKHQNRTIAILEPTIQFSHLNHYSLITQREVGIDMKDLGTGIEEALHQDQDIICIDELNSPETFSKVVQAILKGITVFATMSTPGGEKTIKTLLSMEVAHKRNELINDLMTHLKYLLETKMVADKTGKRKIKIQCMPANLINGILLSLRTQIEENQTSSTMYDDINTSSSVDQSWFDND